MRKFYSFVLMAAALLIGINAQAKTITLGIAGVNPDYNELADAVAAAEDGDLIQLLSNVPTSTKVVWLGTTSATGAGAKHLTLDLGGYTYTYTGTQSVGIAISRGSLTVKNGTLQASAIGDDFIRLWGTYEKINAKTSAPFAELVVESNATIKSNMNVISIDVMREDQKTKMGKSSYDLDYSCEFFTSTFGVANGVKLEIAGKLDAQKYGIKCNGTVRLGKEFMNNASYPEYRKKSSNPDVYFLPGTAKNTGSYTLTASDGDYAPYIHIASSAEVKTSNPSYNKAVAVYASGYARWLIEGTCEGSSGVYVKSGDVDIHDAVVSSNYSGTYDPVDGVGSKSGVTGAGSAVTLESNENYSGSIDVEISGDSKLHAEHGYALEENVTDPTGTKVDYITISGGSFEGGNVSTTGGQQNGTISISQTTTNAATSEQQTTTITVNGGKVDNSANATFGDQDLNAFLNTQQSTNPTHLTTVTDEAGNTTVVISQGAAPTGDAHVKGHDANTNVKWTGTSETIGDGDPEVVEVGELEINEMWDDDMEPATPAIPVIQTLTIKDGHTLKAERVILGHGARIIVEAGAKFIVKGSQGIIAPVVENIVLKTSEAAQAIFLFNPNVSSNRHPNATVELHSKAYSKGGGEYVWQRFGVPTYDDKQIQRQDISYEHSTTPTAWKKGVHQEWENLGAEEFMKPFACYALTTSATEPIGVYEFECPLMGNDNASLSIEDEWNYYANSYMAPININAIFGIMDGSVVEGTMYLYNPENNWWFEINKATYLFHSELPREVNPMQAFVFHRRSEGANPVINYANHVYNPFMNPGSGAPARSRSSFNKAMVEITAADGTTDCVRMIEDAQFSADFDNSYDASKYMNANSFNLFAGEQLGIIATDNLEGTTLSMTTKDQTSFTMTISQVNGMDYAIRDNLTGTEIEMVEGATYMFSTEANANIEGRFEIVPVAKMPTAIENIEATAATKGIYTVSGQFVGNDYHSLPKGVYVVDGKKIVK